MPAWDAAPVVGATPAWASAPAVQPPEFDHAPLQTLADSMASEHGKPQEGAPVTSVVDAIKAGMEHSVFGTIASRGVSDKQITDATTWYQRAAANTAQMVADMPFMVLGAVGGGSVGGAVGSAVPVVGTATGAVLGAGAGTFALPEAMRSTLMDYYRNGQVKDWGDFWSRFTNIALGTAKSAAVGAATMGVGGKVAEVVGKTAAPAIVKTSAQLASELTTMVGVGAALDGRVPSAQDFADAAVVLVGAKVAMGTADVIAKKLRATYAKTGVTPQEVVQESAKDPTIVQDLAASNKEVPDALKQETQVPPGKGGEPPQPPKEVATGELPERSPAEQAILSQIREEAPAPKAITLSKLYTELVDKYNPINLAEKAAGGKQQFPEGVGPYELQRLTAGIFGKGQQFLQYGAFDFNTYKTTGPSYLKALEPVKADLDGFRAYMASRRAIELEGRGIASGMDLPAAKEVVSAGEAKFEPAFQARLKYRDTLVDYAQQAGLVSEKAVAAMREANKAYVPFYRFFENEERPMSGTQPRNPIKRIKGSERAILDPITSDIKDTFLFLSLAEKNAARQAFVNMGPEFAKPVKAPMRPIGITDSEVSRALKDQGIETEAEGFTAFRPSAYNVGPNEIAVFLDGKRKVFEVDPEVSRAFSSVDAGSASILSSMLRGAASWLRAGVTLSPDFVMRNPVRDAMSAFVYTGAHPIDTIKGAISLWKKDEAFQNWLKGGGANATMVAIDRDYIHQELFELGQKTGLMDRAWNVVTSPVEALRIASEMMENITRIGMRRDALLEAKSKAQVQALSLIAREGTVDFARHGADPFFYQWQRATAFMNPAIQGVDVMFRKMAENPAGTFAKAFAAITLPSLYLWYANHEDPRWKDIPDWERDLFWIVMTPDHIYRVPKPFELGVLFGSFPERVMDAYADHKPDAFKNFAKTMTNVFGFNVVPTATLPLFEQLTNYSFFTDRPLVPSSMEKLLPEYQYMQYTTEATKALGQIVGSFPGLHDSSFASPIVIDNYIRGWSGTMGGYAMQIADAALRKTGVLPDPVMPTKTLSDIPGIRAFVVRYPASNLQSIQDFYDKYNQSQKVIETVKYLAKQGDAAAALKEATLDPSQMYRLESVHRALSTAERTIQLVNKNQTFTPEEKRQLIDSMYGQMIQMARSGNETIQAIESSMKAKKLAETVH